MTKDRGALISQAAIQLMDELEDTVKDFKARDRPQVGDDYVKMHSRLIFVTQVEGEIAHLYRLALKVKNEVEVSHHRATSNLQDKEAEVLSRPTFKSINGFMSRPEVEAKIRSIAIEEVYHVRIWEKLKLDVNYLLDVIRSYQQEASRERRDIDTRLRLLGLY